MNYKKPQVVAKSATKQSYVAGCPAKEEKGAYRTVNGVKIYNSCSKCEVSGR